VGKRRLLMYPVQYAKGQSPPASGPHDVNSQTEATEVAAVRARHFLEPTARKLATLC